MIGSDRRQQDYQRYVRMQQQGQQNQTWARQQAMLQQAAPFWGGYGGQLGLGMMSPLGLAGTRSLSGTPSAQPPPRNKPRDWTLGIQLLKVLGFVTWVLF
jgi:hypothetical protein